MALGRKYSLASGLMELTYQSGAKVILQGPCTYEVDSANGGFLSLGKLTARAERARAEGGLATPFTVRTPTAIAVDLGAGGEFGVGVDRTGKTDASTFRGSVELRPAGGGEGVAQAVILRENESATVGAGQDAVAVTRDTGRPARFTRRLPERATFGAGGTMIGGRGLPRHGGEKANAEETDIDAAELEALVNSDPAAKELAMELGYKKVDENYRMGAGKPGGSTPYVDRYGDQSRMLQEKYDARVEMLRQKVRERQRALIVEAGADKDKTPIAYPDAEDWQQMTARRKDKSGAVDLAKEGNAEKRIREALKSPTQLEFIDTPLSDVIDYLKDMHKIEIQIDGKALDKAGIDANTPITKNLKGISLRSALRLMLREHGLTYVIEDEVLLITTPEAAESRLSTATYPVADLAPPQSKLTGLYSPTRRGESLLGVASLKINVLQGPEGEGDVLTFRSLGVGPRLEVTLVDQSRLAALGWGLALLVGLVGVAITRRPARRKIAYIVAALIFATLTPLVTDSIEVAQVCNMLFYAASLLAPYYLLVALGRWVCGLCHRACGVRTAAGPAAAAVLMLATLLLAGNAVAQPQAADDEESATAEPPYVVQIVKPPAPVKVPDDAIILPYDPDSLAGIKGVGKLLVPYDRYVELWNRAHPDKKIGTKAPPAPYALSGAAYKTLLEGDEYLLLTGQVEIDVFTDEFVQVPLGLGGGVLAQANWTAARRG